MGKIEFEVVSRKKNSILTTIRAQARNPDRTMTVYLDRETQDVLYPIAVEFLVPGITIMLDSENVSSCTLPPSVPASMVPRIIEDLQSFPEVVEAARRLIQTEQEAARCK